MEHKQCKSCNKEIDIKAKKCPYCYSYQKWYYNISNYSSVIFLIFFIVFMYFNPIFNDVKFKKHTNEVNVKIRDIKHLVGKDKKYLGINLVIKNDSKYDWENAVFELTYYDGNGKINFTENVSEYRFYLAGKETKNYSILAYPPDEYLTNKIKIKILDMDQDRF